MLVYPKDTNVVESGVMIFVVDNETVGLFVKNVEIIELLKTPKLNYEFCSKQKRFEEKGELPNNRGQKKDNVMLGKVIFKPKKMEQSFAIHEKSKYWSNLNILKPEEVFLNSHKSFWFDCPDCNHRYEFIL